jgi:hypothetical protein
MRRSSSRCRALSRARIRSPPSVSSTRTARAPRSAHHPTRTAIGRRDDLRVCPDHSTRKSDLDDLLSNRERLNHGLELMIDNPALDWGVHIDRVEIKDVALPESMKRSIARQAEAERERRSRVITAEGELQASETLAQAAEVMTAHPAALQLRLLQTVVEVAAEKNSTLVLPFPVELLRFLERATPPEVAAAAASPEAIATSPPASTDGLVEGRQHDEASEMPAMSSQPTTAPVPASAAPAVAGR